VPIDAGIRSAASEIDPAYLDDVGIWAGDARDIYAFFHTHAGNPETGAPDDLGTILRLDATSGEVLERNDGFIWGHPSDLDESALRRFLIDLHVQLYMPSPWGLIVTGRPRSRDDGCRNFGAAHASASAARPVRRGADRRTVGFGPGPARAN
jgi:hypothetical protein